MDVKQINFKGYDARPLRGVVMRNFGMGEPLNQIACEIAEIGRQTGFKTFVQEVNASPISSESGYSWAQDFITFLKDGKLWGKKNLAPYDEEIAKITGTRVEKRPVHISGGNFFFVKDGEEDALIIGKHTLKTYTKSELRKLFGVRKIYPISQPDFHIDMGIRPLENKTVLVHDKDMMNTKIMRGLRNLTSFFMGEDIHFDHFWTHGHLLDLLKLTYKTKPNFATYKNNKIIEKQLTDFGFNVINVPGALLRPHTADDASPTSRYLLNYMNAIVHKAPNGDLIYITNKSNLDSRCGISAQMSEEINFGFEKAFKESVQDYIKPENIHFISAKGYVPDMLEHSHGGVHCLCAEIPE